MTRADRVLAVHRNHDVTRLEAHEMVTQGTVPDSDSKAQDDIVTELDEASQ